MATKSPLALVEMPGESSGMTEARQTYIDAQKKMLEALESRNQLFDPVLLAMAQGFLGPTKSGSFGESIANVAAAVGPAAEAERKRGIEMAQIRAELAANQYGAAQKGEALKSFTTAMQPGKPGETITVGGQQYPAQFIGMTPEMATKIGMYDKDLGELAFKFLKAQTEGFAVQPTGTVNLRTPGGPTFTPFPGQANELVTIPGIGTLSVSKEDKIALDMAMGKGDAATIFKIADKYMKPMVRPGAAAETAAGTAAPPTGTPGEATKPSAPQIPVTKEQKEAFQREQERLEKEETARREIRTTAEKKLAESAAGRTSQIIEQGNAARQSEPTYVRIETLLNKPGVDRVVGVLEKNGALEQIGSAVEEAVRAGSYSIGAPSIRKILTNAGTPQELIDISMQLASAYAQLNFDARKGLGSGTSVSNFEQQMVNQMGLSLADTVGSAKGKLAFLREQARFRQEVASALKEARKQTPGLQYDDFEETDLFKNKLFPAYVKRQEAIVNRISSGETPRGQVIQPARSTAPRAGAGQERKIDGKTYVRQPDGSYKLKE